MKTHVFSIILLVLFIAVSVPAYAADDPSIKGKLRQDISSAMQAHIKQNSKDGSYIIYDAVAGELKHLKFDKLHEGIIKKGDFYVSCADFVDSKGNKYDIDFLVGDTGKGLTTFEAVVHSINKKKRAYHVED